MKIGFTGTQIGMSNYQKRRLFEILNAKQPESGIHGDCIGADLEFHDACVALGIKTEIYPPIKDVKRAFCQGDVMFPRDDYLSRNHKIVDGCDLMIAAPKGDTEEIRSGTWATVRYARKKNKQVIILKRELEG